MFRITAIGVGALLLTFGIAPAHAEVYCRTGYFTKVHDGGTFTVNWDVTADAAREPLPGRTRAARGCSFRGSFLNGIHRRPQLLVRPSWGQVSARGVSRIIYRSNSPGRDSFSMRFHWMQGTKPSSAIINFNVNVLPHGM